MLKLLTKYSVSFLSKSVYLVNCDSDMAILVLELVTQALVFLPQKLAFKKQVKLCYLRCTP